MPELEAFIEFYFTVFCRRILSGIALEFYKNNKEQTLTSSTKEVRNGIKKSFVNTGGLGAAVVG